MHIRIKMQQHQQTAAAAEATCRKQMQEVLSLQHVYNTPAALIGL
jgi:hypothetical protein